jgi:hypothetical protein
MFHNIGHEKSARAARITLACLHFCTAISDNLPGNFAHTPDLPLFIDISESRRSFRLLRMLLGEAEAVENIRMGIECLIAQHGAQRDRDTFAFAHKGTIGELKVFKGATTGGYCGKESVRVGE